MFRVNSGYVHKAKVDFNPVLLRTLHCDARTGQYGWGLNLQQMLWFLFTLSVDAWLRFMCVAERSA